MPELAPSLLSADFLSLGKQLEILNETPVPWIHCDVMDGRFVPNISFGIPVVKAIRKATDKFLDVHLMIVEPEKYIEAFADAGANGISFHYEATRHADRLVRRIRDWGVKPGIVLNPATPVNVLENLIEIVDYVLLMSVNPGFGGQSFIEYSYQKIRKLRKMCQGKEVLIEVDGGVTLENASKIVQAGADILVAGSAVFKTKDIRSRIEEFYRKLGK